MLNVLDGVATLCVTRDNPASTGHAWSVFLAPGQIVRAAEELFAEEYVLESILALDVEEGFLLVYHFNKYFVDERIAVKVLVSREDPTVPSITGIYDGAEWHEREVRDFHGVNFDGNPNLVPILLPADDFDLHPLLKDDKSRKALREVMSLGEVVTCSSEIEQLFAEEAEEEASTE
ncbi:NADH-quinone oxidoreductase subunit C [Pseudodesulfovibrio tunisiensis]|uniref:NADH-quinone oxidoreductase subunit C n=1 Tax=Pseudodesulfovibrio tunisiensis TaxID=463192 RepID=UPI001FB1D7A6|nr:NADH-quinone oxidoreductase subunit C [Pseudodesulfovibrio tunisiensis]